MWVVTFQLYALAWPGVEIEIHCDTEVTSLIGERQLI